MNNLLNLIHTDENLVENIMVQKPYNILSCIEKDANGNILAKVKNEFLSLNECGPISCSEAGRHLAILGSIALSMQSNSKNYYLAKHASITRKTLLTKELNALQLETKLVSLGKRDGEIFGIVSDGSNNIYYEATIQYQVLSQQLFSKLFSTHKYVKDIHNERSPYQFRRKLSDVSISSNKITGEYGIILPGECEGHFKNYPALPVAVIGNIIGELCIKLFLFNNLQFSKAIILKADMNAYRLAFHKEYLTFKAIVVENDYGKRMLIHCESIIDGIAIVEADVEVVGANCENSPITIRSRS